MTIEDGGRQSWRIAANVTPSRGCTSARKLSETISVRQSASAPYLLEGAVYALEQGGLLLHDANLLYCNGSYATAIVLATFAREELGKWQILLKLRKEVLGGKQLSLKEMADCCGHDAKHRAGLLVVTSRDRAEPAAIANAMQTMSDAVQGSNEWQAAKDEYERLLAHIKKSIPAERHKNRMSALYVDPISVTEWNRPAKKITRESAHAFLMNVRNEYWLEQARADFGSRFSGVAVLMTRAGEL
jgi:AbiV family abortive infection protein